MKDPISQYCQLEDLAPMLVNRYLSSLLDEREDYLPWLLVQLELGIEAGEWERASVALVIAGRLLGPEDELSLWELACRRMLEHLRHEEQDFKVFQRCLQFLDEQWAVFCQRRELYGKLLSGICHYLNKEDSPERAFGLTFCNLLSLIGSGPALHTLKQLAKADLGPVSDQAQKLLWRKWGLPEPPAPEGALPYREARSWVLQEVNQGQDRYILLDEFTRDVPCGWVFYYTTRDYFSCGEMHLSPLSNGPIIFNRFNRQHFHTQANRPVEYYLDEYERNVLGMKSRWSIALQDPLDAEVQLKAVKMIRAHLGLTFQDSFKVLKGEDPLGLTGVPLTLLKQLYLLLTNELIPCTLSQSDE